MSDLLTWLSSSGHALLGWVLRTNLSAAVLLIAAYAIDRGVARRTRASWRIALYAPVALRVLLGDGFGFAFQHAPRALAFLTPVTLPPLPSSAASAGGSSMLAGLTWEALVSVGFAAVALLLALRWARARAALHAELKVTSPLADDAGAATNAGTCPVIVHPYLGPLVLGVWRARIVVPERLVAGAQGAALARVLRHEAAHVARRDPWLLVAMQLLVIAAWPVVPLWLAMRRVSDLIEIACDERALESADPEERRHYGHTLLDLEEWNESSRLASASALHFHSGLRGRIEALAQARPWPRAVQLALVAAAVLALFACASVKPPEPSEQRLASSGSAWQGPSGVVGMREVEEKCAPYMRSVTPIHEGGVGDFVARLLTAWRATPAAGLPPEQVSYCLGPQVIERLRIEMHGAEARNALAQIGKDYAAAFEQRCASGNCTLCPSAPPLPHQRGKAGSPVKVKDEDWSDHAGFECIKFQFSIPFYFQYETKVDGNRLVATARSAYKLGDGREQEIEMTFRGEVKPGPNGLALTMAPALEERWAEPR
jgi:hypothetical protein